MDLLYVDFTIPERNLTRLKSVMSKGELKIMIQTERANSDDKMELYYYDIILKILSNAVNNKTGTVISMTLSLVIVSIPLVFMDEIVGRILREFTLTVIITVISFEIISLTLTPNDLCRNIKIKF